MLIMFLLYPPWNPPEVEERADRNEAVSSAIALSHPGFAGLWRSCVGGEEGGGAGGRPRSSAGDVGLGPGVNPEESGNPGPGVMTLVSANAGAFPTTSCEARSLQEIQTERSKAPRFNEQRMVSKVSSIKCAGAVTNKCI